MKRCASLFHKIKSPLIALGLGQILSFLVAGTAVFNSALVTYYSVNIPSLLALINYFLILLVYGIIYFPKIDLWKILKKRWYLYLPLALFDVEATYFVVKAYRYTSIMSVMLLDCFTIPCALLLTALILKVRYNWRHFCGVFICLAGLSILVYSDILSDRGVNEHGENYVFGDILCLLASLAYAISNVGQEYSVKKINYYEFLSFIGLFGLPTSATQLLVLEYHEIRTIKWNYKVLLLIFGLVIFLFATYSLMPLMLRSSGSALFNLSLITSDIYAIIAGVYLFNKKIFWLYWIALFTIIAGLLVYNINSSPKEVLKKYNNQDDATKDENNNQNSDKNDDDEDDDDYELSDI